MISWFPSNSPKLKSSKPTGGREDYFLGFALAFCVLIFDFFLARAFARFFLGVRRLSPRPICAPDPLPTHVGGLKMRCYFFRPSFLRNVSKPILSIERIAWVLTRIEINLFCAADQNLFFCKFGRKRWFVLTFEWETRCPTWIVFSVKGQRLDIIDLHLRRSFYYRNHHHLGHVHLHNHRHLHDLRHEDRGNHESMVCDCDQK